MHFNRVLSLLILITVVVAAALMAAVIISDEAAAADPYDPRLKVASGSSVDQDGDPGDRIKYYLDLENAGTEDDTYVITNASIPAGWKVTISPSEVSLNDGDEEQVIVSVTSPDSAIDTDSVDITITATSQDDPSSPPAKATILLTYNVNQIFDITLDLKAGELSSKKVDPGNTVNFLLNVTNIGNGEDTIALTKEYSSGGTGWVTIFSSTQVTLKKDKFAIINVSITAPNSADAGQFQIDVIATSEDGIESDTTTLIADVNYKPDFTVLPYGANQKKVAPLESVIYGVTVENKGNDEDTFEFEIKPGAWSDTGWIASLDYSSITVSQDESANLASFLTVNAPDGLADTEVTIVVNVTSGDGALVKTLNTRTKILQEFDPTINIIGGTTKSVNPGEDVMFTIEVYNAGNGEDEITLSIKNDDQVPGSWGSFSDSSVTLQPYTGTNLTMTVTPPSDALFKDEGYTLQIFGTSEDGENITTTKTLKVNVNKKYDLSVTVSGASTKKVDPDGTVGFTISIRNKGNADDTILLTLYGNDDTWKPQWGSIVSSVDLLPNQAKDVTLSVTVPDDASKADYKIGVQGTSDEDPSPTPVNKKAEVIVSVNQTYAIIITIPAAQKTVDVNSFVDYGLEIKNDGTGEDTLTLEVTVYPDGWQVNFNQSTLVLGAKKTGLVTMTVETPTAENALAFFVNFTVKSQNAPVDSPVVEIGSTITTVNQTYEFDVLTDPDYSSTKPGKTIEFTISFENKGTGDDHVKVQKSGDFPATWTVSIASDVSLLKGQTVSKKLTVSIDDETLKGEYHITLTGTSNDDPHTPAFSREVDITINVEQDYNLTASISIDTQSIDPFPQEIQTKVTFVFTVNNTGTGLDKFEFTSVFDASPVQKNGWSVAFSPETIALGVKKEGQVSAIVTVPFKENIGTYGLTITAISQGDSTARQTVKVFIDVNQTYSLDIISNFNSQQVTPSKIASELKNINFTITVSNTGTGDDKFFFTLTGLPAGWFKNLVGNSGVMTKDQSKDFILNIKVPGREDPDTYSMNFIANSDGRPQVKVNVTLDIVVNELNTLEVTSNEVTKKGAVEDFTNFVVVVTNKGTGSDTFTFDYRDVPTQLTVSFPDGTGTEEIGPNNQTTKVVRVFVEAKTIKARFSFNVTVTSDEDESVQKMIMLTLDVNQSYEISAFLIASPPSNKMDPGDIDKYQWEIKNKGTGTDTITIEIPATNSNGTKNVPAGWKVEPKPNSFDLDSEEFRSIDLEVEVDKKAVPETVNIEVLFHYHDLEEHVTGVITIIVNQTFDLSLTLDTTLLQIFPGFSDQATLTIKNTGTGPDYYAIAISTVDGITPTAQPSSLTQVLDPDDTVFITLDFEVKGGEDPRTETFWINVTSKGAEDDGLPEVIKNKTIDVKVKETYGVTLDKTGEIHTISPTHDANGIKPFQIKVTNDGTSTDSFTFEFANDPVTAKYKSWMTLPNSQELDAGLNYNFDLLISVPPEKTDDRAVADGKYKNITITVYSVGARDNNVEVPGVTTETYLCNINLEEYDYASFTSVTPRSLTMDVDETREVTVELKNEGNSIETYSFINDGEDGTGLNNDYFNFSVDTILLAPREAKQVTIYVHPKEDATAEVHRMEFYAESEGGTFSTADVGGNEYFTITIEEKFGGEFGGGDTKTAEVDTRVTMKVSVKNTGNADHLFYVDDPTPKPTGWQFDWQSDSQTIPANSAKDFRLEITVPSDYTKAVAGLYQFIITGDYETEGGGTAQLPGFALLNLTISTEYGVVVSSDDANPTADAEPGESIIYTKMKVKNNGNTNDTYKLSILSLGSDDITDWVTIQGNDTRPIPTGVTMYITLEINIPEFTPENDDAEKGDYGFTLKASSLKGDDDDFDTQDFALTVLEMFSVKLWSDIPGKNETLKENDPTLMSYSLFCRNLGNTDDDIVVTVPTDEFSGEKKDWIVKFGTKTSITLTLETLKQSTLTLDLTIDKNTDPGEYTLRVRAESQGDTAVAVYSTIYINLTKATYGVQLNKFPSSTRKVNPSDESEIEFKFTLTNTGNQDDTYTVEVETPLGSGPYKGWIMEFEDKTENRVSTLNVPADLKGNTDLYISKNGRVDITLYVIVAFDEDEGDYSDIAISATSDNDNSQVAYMYFNLTVILPNIRVSDDPKDFWIEPDKNIEEGDDIDINVKIYNDGGAETDTFYVWFYNGKGSSGNEIGGNENSGLIGWEKVDNIPAGQFYEVLTTWEDILGGENDIYVYADKPIKSGDGKTFIDNVFSSDGLVLESKENDNTASIDDDYQKAIDLRPDLTITRVEVDDPERDTTTTVTVTVANVGSAKALSGTGTISLKIGGTSIKADTLSFKGINPFLPEDIDVNDDIDIEFKWDVPDEKKNYTIKVTADLDEDSDSSNDRYSGYVWSTDPGGGLAGGDSNFLLMAGLGGFSLLLLLLVVVLLMKVKKLSAGGPPAGGPPKKGKGPKGKPGKRPPGKPGGKAPPGAKGPPKPGQKPITPPGAKGKPGGPPGKPGGPPGARPGGPPGARPGGPPGARPGGPPGGPGKSMKPCPKCKTPIPITTAKRPLKLICPKCGASGTLNK